MTSIHIYMSFIQYLQIRLMTIVFVLKTASSDLRGQVAIGVASVIALH